MFFVRGSAARLILSPSPSNLLSRTHVDRNPGVPLDLEWVNRARVNLPAVKRRADTLKTRRSVKKQWQAAWLLRAVTCIDLTTLSGDDTATNVARLCFKAQNPVRQDLLESMGMADKGITTGAVCVYSSRVPDAVRTLKDINSKIPIASLAAGFPAGRKQATLDLCYLMDSSVWVVSHPTFPEITVHSHEGN